MSVKIKLPDLIDAIQFQSDLGEYYIHLKTGNIYFVSEEAMSMADKEAGNFPEWQKEEIKIARHLLDNKHEYIPLPSKDEINEYQMMEKFSENLENEKIVNQLLIVLKGKGAFRRFKDTLNLWNLEEEWYKFKDEEYKKLAVEWCQENAFVFD